MSALGAFSQSIIVSTVYTNLGDEAVMHALNETEVNIVVTSHELLPKFRTMLDNCPNITHVIYMEDQIFQTDESGFKVQNILYSTSQYFWGVSSQLYDRFGHHSCTGWVIIPIFYYKLSKALIQ